MERNRTDKIAGFALAGGGWLAAFIFWALVYPYHFIRREQLSLFLLERESLSNYTLSPGWFSRFAADFLTQFFCIPAAGPAICALFVALTAYLVYTMLRRYCPLWLSILAGLGALTVTFLRECGLEGALASNISITMWLASICIVTSNALPKKKNAISAAILGILCITMAGFPTGAGLSRINLQDEHNLAIDIEAYNGNWDKVRKLSQKSGDSIIASYFRNLGNASENMLSERLLESNQPFERGLFLQIGEKSSPYAIAASGEVWYRLGEMTMAEHSTILGMIFSPRHTGSRFLRRLAEINLINGDDEAAMKYLRMLGSTIMWRKWALERTPGKQTAEVKTYLESMRKYTPANDVVSGTNERRGMLLNLLNSNPDNIMAHEYLLCYDLMMEDLDTFIADYSRGVVPIRIFSEAALLYLVQNDQLNQESIQYFHISESLYNEFVAFNQCYQQNEGRVSAMKERFGNTYWFFYSFAKRNE